MAGVVFCALGGFTQHITTASAAVTDEQDLMTLDYLDPFNLTVTPLTVTRDIFGSTGLLLSSDSDISPDDYLSSLYVQPLKIWIPYRPMFRSPCAPSPY